MDEVLCHVEDGDEEVGAGELDHVGRAALRTLDGRLLVALLLLVHPAVDTRLMDPFRRPTAPGTFGTWNKAPVKRVS